MPETTAPAWTNHLGLIASTGAFALVVCRILGMSHFDPQTASAVISAGGAANVALAAAVASAPSFGSILIIPAAVVAGRVVFEQGWTWLRRAWFALAIGVFAALLFIPMSFVVGGAILAVVSAVFPWWRTQSMRSGDRASLVGALPAWFVMIALTTSLTPYLPAESFDPADGDSFTGYVLGREDDGTLVILTEAERHVIREPANVSHEFCDPEGKSWYAATLLELARDTGQPDCPR